MKPVEPWRRTLYIVWAAQFIAMLGMSFVVPFLPFYVRALGVTDESSVALWSGLIFAGPFLPAFILTPVWGFLGDKYGYKLMTVRAVFGLALSQLLIGLAPTVEILLLFRMVQGAISGFLAAALTLVSSHAPRHRSGYAIGMLQTATSSGSVLGPFLGGMMADAIGYRSVFFLVAGMCTITAVIIMVYVSEPKRDPSTPTHRISLQSNIRFVWNSPALRLGVILIVLSQSAVFLVQPVFALYIDSMFSSAEYIATVAGAIFAVAGIFTVLSAPWWGRRNDEKSMRKNLSIAFAGAATAYVLHFFIHHPVPLVLIRSLLGFCLGGMLPSLYAYVNKHSTIPRRGGILGVATSGNTLAHLIGAPLGGLIGAQIGVRSVFLFAGIILMTAVWTVRTFFTDIPASEMTTDET